MLRLSRVVLLVFVGAAFERTLDFRDSCVYSVHSWSQFVCVPRSGRLTHCPRGTPAHASCDSPDSTVSCFAMTLGISSFSGRVPLSTRELAELSRSFRRAARERGFSARRAERYETWMLAFVSWCWDHDPGCVSPDRIGGFRSALDASSDTDSEQIGEAMDALAFLFGSARDALAVLSATGMCESARDDEASPRDRSSNVGFRTIDVGWRGAAGGGDGQASATGTTMDRPNTSRDNAPDEVAEEGGASTAEICIQRYQDRLESLHPSDRHGERVDSDPTPSSSGDVG